MSENVRGDFFESHYITLFNKLVTTMKVSCVGGWAFCP